MANAACEQEALLPTRQTTNNGTLLTETQPKLQEPGDQRITRQAEPAWCNAIKIISARDQQQNVTLENAA